MAIFNVLKASSSLRFGILLLFFYICGIDSYGQTSYLQFFRDYKQNLAIIKSDEQTDKFIVSQYGTIESIYNQNINNRLYLFQGQEFDHSLNLFFFPARIYSAQSKRFFQPDPLSQYFSPYSYVNGDPVNSTDYNGEEGKPLILYSNDHSVLGGKDHAVADLLDEVPDAYHYPISDFMNGSVGNLPEWDGRVFVISHSKIESPNLEVNRGVFNRKSLYRGEGAEINHTLDGTFSSCVDGENLGKTLKEFSLKNEVELKSVVLGSCESETAAKALASGFSGSSTDVKKPFKVTGLRKGYQSKVKGPKSLKNKYGDEVTPPDHSHYMLLERDKHSTDFLYQDKDGNVKYFGHYYPRENEAEVPVTRDDFAPSISGDQLQDFIRTGEFSRAPNGSLVNFTAHY